MNSRLLTLGAAALVSITVLAQSMQLPKEISGRWSFSGGSNIFSLEDIAPTSDGGFTAKLTWWTRDPACVVRNEPISGKTTTTGISFDSKTKCGVEFSVELTRSEKQWLGKGTTSGGVVVDIRAQ
jgi:hypothetical protein